jgi:uncharacterized protein (TIGR02265 family)
VTATARKAPAVDSLAHFVAPSWTQSLDVEMYLERCPADINVRGMYFNGIVRDILSKISTYTPSTSYRAFHYYPLRDFMALVVEAASLLYPMAGAREGIRLVGRNAYRDFADSTIGKVILGAVKNDVSAILSLATKAYGVSMTQAKVGVVERGDHYAILSMSNVYNFLDTYQVGVFEGVFLITATTGEVKIHRTGHSEAQLLLTWS